MPRRFLAPALAGAFALVLATAACQPTPTADTGDLSSLEDSVAYVIGHDLGSTLNQQMEQVGGDADLDRDLIVAAVRAGLNGDTLAFDQQEVQAIMTTFQDTLSARQNRANLTESSAFLEETAALDSVQATDSGLLYKIIETGDGATPSVGDTVVVNYRGTLPDGTEFDSSFNRGQPAQFVVGEVIPGWNEALQLMQVGAQYELYIPADLAYGEQAPPQIGPNRALIFEVELLDVMPAGQ